MDIILETTKLTEYNFAAIQYTDNFVSGCPISFDLEEL